jgi:hypothetical protein
MLEEDTLIEFSCWSQNKLTKPSLLGVTVVNLNELSNDKTVKFNKKLGNFYFSQTFQDQTESGSLQFEITAKNFPKGKTVSIENRKEAVLNKLMNSQYKELKTHKEKGLRDKFDNMVNDLSDPVKFKQVYLSTDWADALKLQNEINQSGEFDEENLHFEGLESDVQEDEDDEHEHEKSLEESVKFES